MPQLISRITATAVAVLLTLVGPSSSARADEEGQAHTQPAAPGGTLLQHPGVQVRPRAGAPALPGQLSARSWLVADADTGAVLAAKDVHRPLPPASTLKTLFAVTLLPRLPQDALHRVSARDLADVGPGSSLVGVQPGKHYRVADLWRGVFLSSGNDAVHALAAINGSLRTTVRQMQATARQLGASHTRVVSPDGYDQPGQVSSAYDLSLFARAGLADPRFVRHSSTPTARFPTGRTADGTAEGFFRIQNTNRLLVGAPGIAPYPGLLGVKNGYTSQAGNTLVVAARRDGRTLLATVMNPRSGRTNAVYDEARALLDWGFAAAGHVTPVGALVGGAATRVDRGGPHRAAPHHRAPAAGRTGAAAEGPDHPSGVVPRRTEVVLRVSAGAAGLAVCAAVPLYLRRRRIRRTYGQPVLATPTGPVSLRMDLSQALAADRVKARRDRERHTTGAPTR